jgi:prolyl-tRNA synthetase
MASVVERWHDEGGIIFPITIAPFQIELCPLGKKQEVLETADALYTQLKKKYEVLYDDRDDSPGVKLKDADLLGIPVRVVVSQKLMKKEEVEVKVRRTGEVILCPRKELESVLERIVRELQPSLEGLPYLPE